MSKEKNDSPQRPYGGLAPDRRRESRQEKLIDAGFELFGEFGYNDVTIEQICAAASVGIRSLYSEFGTREALFRAVYDRVTLRAYNSVKKVLDGQSEVTLETYISNSIGAYLHQMLDDPRNGRIVSIESGRWDVFLGKHRNQVMNKFASLAASHLPNYPAGEKNSLRVWSLMMTGGINEIVIDALIADKEIDIDALVDLAAGFCLRSLPVSV